MNRTSNNILIVEDNDLDAENIQREIEKLTSVEPIITREKNLVSLKTLNPEDYKMVFLDLNLEDSEAVETLNYATRHFENCPIVIITGNDDFKVLNYAKEIGHKNFFIKGQSIDGRLSRLLSKYLRGDKAELDDFKEPGPNKTYLRTAYSILSAVERKELRTGFKNIFNLDDPKIKGFKSRLFFVDSELNRLSIEDKQVILSSCNLRDEYFLGGLKFIEEKLREINTSEYKNICLEFSDPLCWRNSKIREEILGMNKKIKNGLILEINGEMAALNWDDCLLITREMIQYGIHPLLDLRNNSNGFQYPEFENSFFFIELDIKQIYSNILDNEAKSLPEENLNMSASTSPLEIIVTGAEHLHQQNILKGLGISYYCK